jgi:L-amino acid N-acyltransferase YncA
MKIIRKMQNQDLDSVEKVAKLTWRHTYKGIMTEEFLEEFIKMAYSKKAINSRARDTVFYVVEEEKEVVGFINYFPHFFGYNQSVLAAIYVEPNFQRRGLGTQLIEHVLQEFPQNTKLYADIERDNKIGREFFESKGFIFNKNIEEKIGDHPINRVRVVLEK